MLEHTINANKAASSTPFNCAKVEFVGNGADRFFSQLKALLAEKQKVKMAKGAILPMRQQGSFLLVRGYEA
jgi:hypothetical protein